MYIKILPTICSRNNEAYIYANTEYEFACIKGYIFHVIENEGVEENTLWLTRMQYDLIGKYDKVNVELMEESECKYADCIKLKSNIFPVDNDNIEDDDFINQYCNLVVNNGQLIDIHIDGVQFIVRVKISDKSMIVNGGTKINWI